MRQTSNTKDLGALSSYLSSVLVEWRPETGQHTPQAAESHSVAVQAYERSSLDGQIGLREIVYQEIKVLVF